MARANCRLPCRTLARHGYDFRVSRSAQTPKKNAEPTETAAPRGSRGARAALQRNRGGVRCYVTRPKTAALQRNRRDTSSTINNKPAPLHAYAGQRLGCPPALSTSRAGMLPCPPRRGDASSSSAGRLESGGRPAGRGRERQYLPSPRHMHIAGSRQAAADTVSHSRRRPPRAAKEQAPWARPAERLP